MKVAVFGIEGQLGCDVAEALAAHDVIPISHDLADITDADAVAAAVAKATAEWVINCAAMTNVDGAETQADQAFAANATGARNVAHACAAANTPLVHISTDYVFDGRKDGPYVETDATRPVNIYGMSKLVGEWLVQDEQPEHYIMRTSGLYGTHPCRGKGTNFVETMLRLAGERDRITVVSDERLTPTFTADLARQIATMIEQKPSWGVYHATNEGSCSWYEFAAAIFEIAGTNVEVAPILSAEWKAATRRAPNTVLANAALEAAGLNTFPDWRDALKRYLAARS